jgi:hypothetical protein
MPKRTDLKKILIIGSGPIVIGQACEFDYSGTQGCRSLREEGFEVVLVNSNPATIMTDPEMAHRTYVEPLTPEFVAKIIERERPDALLPTLGGQTALNLAVALSEDGTLERFGVELIGAKIRRSRRPRTASSSRPPSSASAWRCPARATRDRWRTPRTSCARPAIRRSSGRRSRWAAPAPPSPTTPRSWRARCAGVCRCRPSAAC